MDSLHLKIIAENPIGNGLDRFYASFRAVCETVGVSCTPDAVGRFGQEDAQNLALDLLSALQSLRASRLLPSKTGGKPIFSDLLSLNAAIVSNSCDLAHIEPILNAALASRVEDVIIWARVYDAVTESTPPPRPMPSSLQQTPWSHSTSSVVNSSEYRQDVDRILKVELGPLHVGLPNFHKKFFGGVAGLEAASIAVFGKCTEGDDPLFGSSGWRKWPAGAREKEVLAWFSDIILALETFARDCSSIVIYPRKLLAQPKTPLLGSTAKRSMDIGFVDRDFVYNSESENNSRYRWSHILVPGELKSNPTADTLSIAWIDLATYTREVLSAQETRRFTLGFTLCGSLMRVWEFDRLGGIASEQFDINQNGLQFVCTILGFLCGNEEVLGFDPTIKTAEGQQFIEIQRHNSTQRLIIDEVMSRRRCIAGRATTCWKAHAQGDPRTPLVIKDSWQYPERGEEGEMLREATEHGVLNVARYYHSETIQVHGMDDDIRNNVRGGLDITKAANYRRERSRPPLTVNPSEGASRKGRSSSSTGKKRSSSQTSAPLPPNKRSYSASLAKPSRLTILNRVHRRIILRDYGIPIYKASSRSALLAGLEGCIEGHKSLHEAGILHRDISINNLMINEDDNNPSWPSFLIDLDLAIKQQRDGISGAHGKTGTRAFMAIGALLGEQHSFMHDLESFFWVLFWICIHYKGPDESRVVAEFDQWNYISMELLAKEKKGQVSHEGDFVRFAEENFTPYYQPLIPWVNRLRNATFPNGGRWEKEDTGLFVRMQEIIKYARRDPKVLEER